MAQDFGGGDARVLGCRFHKHLLVLARRESVHDRIRWRKLHAGTGSHVGICIPGCLSTPLSFLYCMASVCGSVHRRLDATCCIVLGLSTIRSRPVRRGVFPRIFGNHPQNDGRLAAIGTLDAVV